MIWLRKKNKPQYQTVADWSTFYLTGILNQGSEYYKAKGKLVFMNTLVQVSLIKLKLKVFIVKLNTVGCITALIFIVNCNTNILKINMEKSEKAHC